MHAGNPLPQHTHKRAHTRYPISGRDFSLFLLFSGDGGPAAAAAASVDIYWRVRDIKARPFIETSLFLTLDCQPGSFVDLP